MIETTLIRRHLSTLTTAVTAVLLTSIYLSALPGRAMAQTSEGTPITSLQDVEQAVVQIESKGVFVPYLNSKMTVETMRGSGFIIDPEGIVVTNAHVVNGGEIYQVFVPGYDRPVNATLQGISECADLALLDLRGSGYPYLQWRTSRLTPRQVVYAVGYPNGEYTRTGGYVQSSDETGETEWASIDHVILHSAKLAPGNSGGPLLDNRGRVVGINYAGSAATGENVAIAKEDALPIIDILRQGIDIDSIGINGQAFSEGQDWFGIWVVAVDSGSLAAKADIRAGDVIYRLENLPVGTDGTMADYCDILRSHTNNETITVHVRAADGYYRGEINGQPLVKIPTPSQTPPTPTPTPTLTPTATPTTAPEPLTIEVPEDWPDPKIQSVRRGGVVVGKSITVDGFDMPVDMTPVDWVKIGILLMEGDQSRDDLEEYLVEASWNEKCSEMDWVTLDTPDLTGATVLWSDCDGFAGRVVVSSAFQSDVDRLLYVFSDIVGDDSSVAGLEIILESISEWIDSGYRFYDIPIGTVDVKSLNLREGPETTFDKVGALQKGQMFFAYGKADVACRWLFVYTDSGLGWIANLPGYVTLDRSCQEIGVVDVDDPLAFSEEEP